MPGFISRSPGPAQNLPVAARRVQPHDARGLRWRTAEENNVSGGFAGVYVGYARVRRLDGLQFSGIRVEEGQVRGAALGVRAD